MPPARQNYAMLAPEFKGGLIMKRATVHPKGKRWYVNLYWKSKRYRRFHYDEQFGFIYKELAEDIATQINGDIKRKGKAFDPRQWFRTPGYEFQFKRFADKWLLDNIDRYAPSVKRDNTRYITTFIEYFKDMDLREIRKADIKEYERTIPEHLAPKTRENILGLLHKIFSDAFDDEMITRVPGFPKIDVPEPEVKWISREWQDKIIGAIPEHDRPIFIFIRTWAVRPGEARALMWDCVDFEKETITIRRTFSGAGTNYLREYTKTRRVRYLPFTGELLELFNKIRGISGYVFRNRGGKPYTADISRIWAGARDSINCPQDITLYQGTRHSFATQHLDQLDLVRQVLGHTRTDMTRKYQGLNLDKVKELGK